MVELKCESAPVTQNEEFIQLANDLAQQLATGPGAATPTNCWISPRPASRARRCGNRRTRCSTASARCSTSAACSGSTARARPTATTPARWPACCWKSRAARPNWPRTSACTSPPCGRSALQKEDVDPAAGREGAGDPARSGAQGRQAGQHRGQDGRRPAAELLRREGAAGAAVRQGRQGDRRPGRQASRHEIKRFVHWELGKA